MITVLRVWSMPVEKPSPWTLFLLNLQVKLEWPLRAGLLDSVDRPWTCLLLAIPDSMAAA
jgi:hypothetical protein